MNRRDFLKKAGLVVAGSLGLPLAADSNAAVYKKVKKLDLTFRGYPSIRPVTIDGEMFYIFMMHPRQKYNLDVMIAREKYRHDRWVERHNRWVQNQGKTSFKMVEGEAGTFQCTT